jgi:hypothetical protein
MKAVVSPSTGKSHGLARVCRVLEIESSRSTRSGPALRHGRRIGKR